MTTGEENEHEEMLLQYGTFRAYYIWEFSPELMYRVLLRKNIKRHSTKSLKHQLFVSRLNHDAIITFTKPIIRHGHSYLASQFRMDYGNCGHLLSTYYKEGLPEVMLQLIAGNVLRGLAYLHSQGIIHRAVCADNVFLDSSGQIRLALTHHTIQIEDCPRWIGQMDRVHNFSGLESLFAWLAPEVLKQDLNGYGIESDIYSFGILICELANGTAPFVEMEPLQILYEKLRGTTPFVVDLNTQGKDSKSFGANLQEFSPALHQMVNESLRCESNTRPSASELLEKYGNSLFAKIHTGAVMGELMVNAMPLMRRFF